MDMVLLLVALVALFAAWGIAVVEEYNNPRVNTHAHVMGTRKGSVRGG
jgi:hypothetical protein